MDGGEWSAYATATSTSFTGLAETSHTFEVRARDAAGNIDTTPAARHFSVRLTPPVISDAAVSAQPTRCTITWTTNVPCTSQVEFGTTDQYGSLSPLDSALVTAHSVTLNGLASQQAYYLRIHSSDDAGLSTTAVVGPVTTGVLPDLQVTSLTEPGDAWVAQAVDVSWTVTDTGSGDATGTWTDRIYLSHDGTLNGLLRIGELRPSCRACVRLAV